jgi:nitrite reductase/ring-hydroxylating ferredoxin subunit
MKSIVKMIAVTLVVLALAALLAACGGKAQGGTPVAGSAAVGGPASSSKTVYRPKALNPTVSTETVSLASADIASAANGSFVIGNMSFMAYNLDGKTYLRADICPPCGSRSFNLSKGTLICNACGTVFNATTGAGISGACTAYPKAAVAYTSDGTNVVTTMDALTTAFTKTINRQGLQ